MSTRMKIFRVSERTILQLINGYSFSDLGDVFAASIPNLNIIPPGSIVRAVYYNAQYQAWDIVLINNSFEETVAGCELPVINHCNRDKLITTKLVMLTPLNKEAAKEQYTKAWNAFRQTFDDDERRKLMRLMDNLQPYISDGITDEWKQFVNTLDGFNEYWANITEILWNNT